MRLFVWILALLFGTQTNAAEFQNGNWVLDDRSFFPYGAFAPEDPTLDAHLNQSHSNVLRALDEAPLINLAKEGALIRLSVIPWRSNPFVFRVSRLEDGFGVNFKLAWGIASNAGGVDTQDRFPLSTEAFVKALTALQIMDICASSPWAELQPGASLWIVDTLNGPYCVRAFGAPLGEPAADLLSAVSSPLRGLPSIVRRELNQALQVGE